MKKVFSLLLALVLVLTSLPMTALAAEQTEDTSVTVYFTVESGIGFVDAGGYTMGLQKLTVPYFDLALYGLEEIYYNPNCYSDADRKENQKAGTKEMAEGHVTILHLMIYATEIFKLGVEIEDAGKGALAEEGWPHFNFHQIFPGSTFINFWDYGYNINYYLNYMYPLGKPGWGSTCDQIELKNGDVLTLRFENNNGNCGTFHHFGKDGIVSQELLPGNQLNLTLYQTTKSTDYSGTGHEPVGAGAEVYVCTEPGGEALVTGTTNAAGDVQLDTSSLEKGRYYVCSKTFGPAVMQLLIGEHDYIPEVVAPTCTRGGYTIYTCACGHSYTADRTPATGHTEGDICTVCGQSTAIAIYGDVDGDGRISATDVSLVAQVVANLTENADLAAADVDGDGKITATDVSLIAQFVANLITQFPAEGTNN